MNVGRPKTSTIFIHTEHGRHQTIGVAVLDDGFTLDIGPATVFLDQAGIDHLAAILAPFVTPAADGIDDALAAERLSAQP